MPTSLIAVIVAFIAAMSASAVPAAPPPAPRLAVVNLPLPETPFDSCAATSFSGDYNGIDAYGGRVVALFPVVSAKPAAEQRVRAAIVRFRPGTQELQ